MESLIKVAVFFVVSTALVVMVDAAPKNQLQSSSTFLNQQELIDHVNSVGSTWTAGHNARFDNIPISTIKRMMGSLQQPNSSESDDVSHVQPAIAVNDLPDDFDAREQWPQCQAVIGDIRDQGACGDCWAIAAASAISDRICIASNGLNITHISAEDLNDCCGLTCGFGCDGGFALQAWQYWVKHGIVTGGNYNTTQGCMPYTIPACNHDGTPGHYKPCGQHQSTPACVPQCEPGYNVQYTNDKHFGQTAYPVNQSELSIRAEIYQNGPVETTITVYEDFIAYKSGVYQHITGSNLGLHAVKIFGWGLDGATNNTPYWWVANTWNEDWGDNGFVKIIRGVDALGMEDAVVAGLP